MAKRPRNVARDYRHTDEALLRPESGAQDVFPPAKRKPPRTWRYDSSLAPELAWDEAAARSEGERLIREILDSDTLPQARQAAERLKRLSTSFLNWSGKAERGSVTVPTLPLFVHERLSTQAVLETLKRRHPERGQTLDLFGEGDKSIGEKIRGAYEHLNGWQNRLILGDSLQVMHSLLDYEGLGGQVQMIYMDPPYGVKFGGNFQPFVRRRDVKDGDDDALSREPEMVRAYRDTWELGIHSWLTYMRDRLLLAREMLTDSGSCFVQISDENVHLARSVMDEVFGAENQIATICYKKPGQRSSLTLPVLTDFVLWYAKDKTRIKYCQLYVPKSLAGDGGSHYNQVELADGTIRTLSEQERFNPNLLPDDSKVFQTTSLTSAGSQSGEGCFEFQGRKYYPPAHKHWSCSLEGLKRIAKADRILPTRTTMRFKRYFSDLPLMELDNRWNDVGLFGESSYVVQTSTKVIQRCLLMTTDPGDLVLDPTCGSGTTAAVAEQWGRRWITTDVSRVPLALARQRLLTATYPYYQLKDAQRGPAGGFVYARKQNRKGEEVGGIVPHVTLKSIANDEPPAEEVLVDKPETEPNVTRITGPFCVEAVLPTPLSPDADPVEIGEPDPIADDDEDRHFERMIEVLRLSPVLKLPGNQTFTLAKVRPPGKSLGLHAEAENPDTGEAVAVLFGPANGAVSERAVIEAGKEAHAKNYTMLLVIAFAIEPAARETVQHGEATFGLPALYAQASTDLVMSDLLKNTRSSQIFAVVGLPDVALEKLDEQAADGGDLWQVTLRGLDVFDPASMDHTALQGDDVPCWMLDTDYDGQCFRAGQVFFPRTLAWDKIRRAVRADFDDAVWERLRGAVSAPFAAGEQIAVKVLDDRGNELLVVKKPGEAG